MKSHNLLVLNLIKIKMQCSKIKTTQNSRLMQTHLTFAQTQRENAPLIVLMTMRPTLLNNISKL